MTTTKRFTKGQVIYQVCQNLASITEAQKNGDTYFYPVTLGAVVERQVDSCGAKQVTFYNRGGNDSVFGRSNLARAAELFADSAAAFEYLRNCPRCDVICPDVLTDANKIWLDDLRNSVTKIAEK